MSATSARLQPTFWRTCRALANRQRLRMLRHLLEHGPETVSEVAEEMHVPPQVASQYLRILNARGLLRATRHGRQVSYEAAGDRTVPFSGRLLQALQGVFRNHPRPVEEAFAALTAFTHPRRIVLMQTLVGGPLGLGDIRRRTGISKQAVIRHLRKLMRRGMVRRQHGRYRHSDPRTFLRRALQEIVLHAG